MTALPSELVLPSGLAIAAPFERLAQFCEAQYDIYDGVAIPHDTTLGVFEIVLTVSVNANLTASNVGEIYGHRSVIESALRPIDPAWSLVDDRWSAVSVKDLLNAACSIKGVWLAVATKILHKKRPSLIPMIDSVFMSQYYHRKRYDRWPPPGDIGLHVMRGFRSDLVAVHDPLLEIVAACESRGWSLTPLRALEILIWMARQNRWYQAPVGSTERPRIDTPQNVEGQLSNQITEWSQDIAEEYLEIEPQMHALSEEALRVDGYA